MHSPLARVRIIAVALIALLLLVVIFVPVAVDTQWGRALQDFGHGPVFGCIALLMLPMLSRGAGTQRPMLQPYLLAFGATALLGAVVELVQIPVGRDASWTDLRSDALGAGGFLALAAAFDARLRGRWLRICTACLGVLLLVVHSLPLIGTAKAYARRAEIFPALAAFSAAPDLYFVAPQWSRVRIARLPAQWIAAPGESALHVTFETGPYPGISFYEPSPDWSGYATLALDLINPTAESLTLVLRANDRQHDNTYEDRFNRELTIAAGARSVVRIPISDIAAAPRARTMDLSHMTSFILFRTDHSRAAEMYVARVSLQR